MKVHAACFGTDGDPLAIRYPTAYLAAMARQVDIGGGLSDFWDYVRADRPHRWPVWGVTIALTAVVFWGFSTHLVRPDKPQRGIVYFENWSADRSIEDSKAEWVGRAKEATRRNAERRASYQRLADRLGIDYDSKAADDATREVLGREAADILAPAAPPSAQPARSARPSLAERAAGMPAGDRTPPSPEAMTRP